MKHIACLHTVFSVIPSFTELLKRELEEECLIDTMYDDFLAADPRRNGGIFTENNYNRFVLDMQSLAMTGADLIVVSCSTLSPHVRRVRKNMAVPIVAIDDGMAAEAVRHGDKIGMIATARSTVAPSSDTLHAAAALAGKNIVLETRCDERAIEMLNGGDKATHDALVCQMAHSLKHCDVIVLAQASTAYMEERLRQETGLMVFSSPKHCMRQINDVLRSVK